MTRPVRRTRALALGLLVASMTPGAAFADQATPASVAPPPQAVPVAAVPFPNRVNSVLREQGSPLRIGGEPMVTQSNEPLEKKKKTEGDEKKNDKKKEGGA